MIYHIVVPPPLVYQLAGDATDLKIVLMEVMNPNVTVKYTYTY